MTLGVNPLPFDAVVLATLCYGRAVPPRAGIGSTRVPQNWTRLFVAARLARSVKAGGIVF